MRRRVTVCACAQGDAKLCRTIGRQSNDAQPIPAKEHLGRHNLELVEPPGSVAASIATSFTRAVRRIAATRHESRCIAESDSVGAASPARLRHLTAAPATRLRLPGILFKI